MENKVQILREEKDLTQRELSNKINLTETQIRNIEKNRSIPRVDIAIKIARELGKTVEEIFIIKD